MYLNDGFLFGGNVFLNILLQSSQHHWLQKLMEKKRQEKYYLMQNRTNTSYGLNIISRTFTCPIPTLNLISPNQLSHNTVRISCSALVSLTVNWEHTCLSFSTWASVLRSPNSIRKATWEGNCAGSRKFKRLNSSSTLFCSGVPVSNIRCS